jgi:hypothetical protein
MTVTLIVPAGTLGYPIAHGTTSYEPYRDASGLWLVDVPPEVAAHLIKVGGFAMADRRQNSRTADVQIRASAVQPICPSGMVAMRHPEGIGCSFAGRGYAPDAKGVVLVPVEAAAELIAHGFRIQEPGIRNQDSLTAGA